LGQAPAHSAKAINSIQRLKLTGTPIAVANQQVIHIFHAFPCLSLPKPNDIDSYCDDIYRKSAP
jgi:hypothetical protein